MQQKFFLHLAYMGTKYRGWQRQAGIKSVQQTLEEALARILKTKVNVHGCGRTDAGVHASQYFAQIVLGHIPEFNLVERLNHVLPNDISIYDMIPVGIKCHAQHDALSRSYEYRIHLDKVAILHGISSYYIYESLDLAKIRAAVEIIKKTKDFRSLCKSPDIYKHTLCEIHGFRLDTRYEDRRLIFTISANRFLRGMVRNIVARMLDIGSGVLSLSDFENTLATRQSFVFPCQRPAHPDGLYLSKVVYPYLEKEVVGIV